MADAPCFCVSGNIIPFLKSKGPKRTNDVQSVIDYFATEYAENLRKRVGRFLIQIL